MSNPDKAPAALAAAEIVDENGGTHTVGELWRERPAVLLFVRHFG
jgi:hypothetical protein